MAAGVSWAAESESRAEGLQEYEVAVTDVFDEKHARALCLYDRRLLRPELVQRAAAVHPSTIEDATGHDGPTFQIAPETPTLMRVTGQIDLSGAGEFSKQIASLVDGDDLVVLDLSAVQFIDIGALRVLVDAVRNSHVRVSRPSRPVRSLASLTGMDRILFGDAAGESE